MSCTSEMQDLTAGCMDTSKLVVAPHCVCSSPHTDRDSDLLMQRQSQHQLPQSWACLQILTRAVQQHSPWSSSLAPRLPWTAQQLMAMCAAMPPPQMCSGCMPAMQKRRQASPCCVQTSTYPLGSLLALHEKDCLHRCCQHCLLPRSLTILLEQGLTGELSVPTRSSVTCGANGSRSPTTSNVMCPLAYNSIARLLSVQLLTSLCYCLNEGSACSCSMIGSTMRACAGVEQRRQWSHLRVRWRGDGGCGGHGAGLLAEGGG